MGPMTDAGYRSFPWGYGATPIEAYRAWKKLQKRTAPPEGMTAFGAPFLIPDAPPSKDKTRP